MNPMLPNNMVVLLCGMIASGKSTFTRRLAKMGWVVVNDDGIVNAVHGGDNSLYDKSFKPIYKTMEHHLISTAIVLGKNVVIDRPNFRLSTRTRYVALAKGFDKPVVCVTFPRVSPDQHALRRFQHDPRGYDFKHWEAAAKRHDAEWEDPRNEEGFDNIVPVHVAVEMIDAGLWSK